MLPMPGLSPDTTASCLQSLFPTCHSFCPRTALSPSLGLAQLGTSTQTAYWYPDPQDWLVHGSSDSHFDVFMVLAGVGRLVVQWL